ncbi:GxGYxYP domain-containing protein [Actinopolymorpha sp. B17G11]|uniref:GxGYxYP domain-containing protein n=1 Tax=unclassified Actinopolymorpha TaxID=2627063 RepID=UPI0032D932BE
MDRTPSNVSRRRFLLASTLPIGLSVLGSASPANAAPPTSGISWPEGQALPHFARPRHLDVVNLLSPVPNDEKVMFTTLQGLVNRSRPRLYLLHTEEEGAYTWLEDLGLPWDEQDRWEMLSKYQTEAKGMVVWDPSIPDTVNVATTLAGIHDALAVSPQLAARLSEAPYRLTTLVDLRDRFDSGLDAYRWQFEELWDKTTHRMVVALNPEVHLGFFRDYAVANRAMVFWLEVNAAEERALLEDMLSAVDPYTPYMGWFASDIAGEFAGTELVSQHAAYVVPADWFANGTVFAGARPPVSDQQQSPPTPRLENRIYVTFTLGEGDNFAYNQHHMRNLWENDARGSVPINWTTNPLLADGAPAILAHYQQTATENDYLVAGPSGAGYIYPTAWPDATFSTYTATTGAYMKRTGMDSIQILNRVDHEDVDLSDEKAHQFATDVRPRGWFIHHTDHTEMQVVAGVPQATGYLVNSVEQTKNAIAESAADWDGTSPLFVSIAPIAWSMNPADLAEVANSLSDDYTVVRGDHFLDLAREALGLPPMD